MEKAGRILVNTVWDSV